MCHSTLWKLQNFPATVFSLNFRQITVLLKKLYSQLIWRKVFLRGRQWISRFSTLCTQCGYNGNLLSLFFGKNSVKVTFLLKKLLNTFKWFDEIFLGKKRNLFFTVLFFSIMMQFHEKTSLYAADFMNVFFTGKKLNYLQAQDRVERLKAEHKLVSWVSWTSLMMENLVNCQTMTTKTM